MTQGASRATIGAGSITGLLHIHCSATQPTFPAVVTTLGGTCNGIAAGTVAGLTVSTAAYVAACTPFCTVSIVFDYSDPCPINGIPVIEEVQDGLITVGGAVAQKVDSGVPPITAATIHVPYHAFLSVPTKTYVWGGKTDSVARGYHISNEHVHFADGDEAADEVGSTAAFVEIPTNPGVPRLCGSAGQQDWQWEIELVTIA